jgi:phenylacetate-CoA ligase
MNKWDILNHAKKNDSYYQELYFGQEFNGNWSQVPITNQKRFWEMHPYKQTTDHSTIIFRSGGTTGKPKCSLFTVDEWRVFTKCFGEGLKHSGLKAHDRVANLFFSGDLYASFLFIKDSLENSPFPIEHFPVSGGLSHQGVTQILTEYPINVLAGVPSAIVQLAEYILLNKLEIKIETILFGGEFLFKNQKDFLEKVFPGVCLNSIGHASVDAGHLGQSCGESLGVHKVFSETSLMEIVDEMGNVITTPNVSGKLIYTNFTRKLMPIVRYPVGDNAYWVEVGETYCLQGRSDEGVRIGPVSVAREDFLSCAGRFEIIDFQFYAKRNELDFLEVALVSGTTLSSIDVENLIKSFYQIKPMYLDCVNKKLIGPLTVKQIASCELKKNDRTGKLILCIDERFASN